MCFYLSYSIYIGLASLSTYIKIKFKYSEEAAVEVGHSKQSKLAFQGSTKQKHIYHIILKILIYGLRVGIRTMIGDFYYIKQLQMMASQ